MSLQSRISIDRETIIAMAILWLLSLACAIAMGYDISSTGLLTFVGVLVLGAVYSVENGERKSLIDRPSDAIFFFAIGAVLASLSFAGDCLYGSIRSPESSLLTACTTKAGIGFPITVLLLAFAVGIPLIGLFRFTVTALWKRDA